MKTIKKVIVAGVLIFSSMLQAVPEDLREIGKQLKTMSDKIGDLYQTKHRDRLAKSVDNMVKKGYTGFSLDVSNTKDAVVGLMRNISEVAYELWQLENLLTDKLYPVIEQQDKKLQEQDKLLDIQTKSLRQIHGRVKVLEEKK